MGLSDMGHIRFRISTAGGDTLEVDSDNGATLKDVLDELKKAGYSFGASVSVGGEPVDEDYEPEDDDVIATHDTPSGNGV